MFKIYDLGNVSGNGERRKLNERGNLRGLVVSSHV